MSHGVTSVTRVGSRHKRHVTRNVFVGTLKDREAGTGPRRALPQAGAWGALLMSARLTRGRRGLRADPDSVRAPEPSPSGARVTGGPGPVAGPFVPGWVTRPR